MTNSLRSVLTLYFQGDGKPQIHKVKIQRPAPNLSREQVRAAADEIEKSRVFNYGILGGPYHLVTAIYSSRKKQALIK